MVLACGDLSTADCELADLTGDCDGGISASLGEDCGAMTLGCAGDLTTEDCKEAHLAGD